ncbi:RING-type E3 ubiquitin transferase [Ranunculus cassubicifolius]
MFSLVFAQSRLYVVTVVFYTCVYIPYQQMKRSLLAVVMCLIQPMECHSHNAEGLNFREDISLVRFEELLMQQCREEKNGGERAVDEQCSVCLVCFEREEEVSQLSGCCHVFHSSCITSWLLRNQFTCPLCRRAFLVKC